LTHRTGADESAASPAGELEFISRAGKKIPLEVVVSESAVGIGKSTFERRKTARRLRIYTFHGIGYRKILEQAQNRALEEAISAGRSKAEFLERIQFNPVHIRLR
jgi:hypothetical protein